MRILPLSLVCLAAAACSADRGPEVTASAGGAITGGTADTTNKAVVNVIYVYDGGIGTTCTGFVIAPNLVVTSAACVANLSIGFGGPVDCATTMVSTALDPSTIVVDGNDTTMSIGSAGQSTVSQILLPSDKHVCGGDLALLVLTAPLSTSPTPLVPRLDVAPTVNETFSTAGYGVTVAPNPNGGNSGPDTSGTRHSRSGLSVVCVDDSCGSDFAGVMTASEFYTGAGLCDGDSGAPAIASDGRVFGLQARGSDCDSSIFERLDSNAAFLQDGAKTAATAGGYAPPAWATAPLPGDASAPIEASTSDTDAASSDNGAASSAPAPSGSSSGCTLSPSRREGDAGLALFACALAAGLVTRRRSRRHG